MFELNYQSKSIEIDKYVLMNSSMAGHKITAIFDNEEDLSYYTFFKGYYNTKSLNQLCSYNDLFSNKGEVINDNKLEKIIEKYFPEETGKR